MANFSYYDILQQGLPEDLRVARLVHGVSWTAAVLQNIIITEIGHGTVLFRLFFIITDLQNSCKPPGGIVKGRRDAFSIGVRELTKRL